MHVIGSHTSQFGHLVNATLELFPSILEVCILLNDEVVCRRDRGPSSVHDGVGLGEGVGDGM